MRHFIFGLLLGFGVSGCSENAGESMPVTIPPPDASALPTTRSMEAIADEYLAAYLERYPQVGTNISLPGARHDR